MTNKIRNLRFMTACCVVEEADGKTTRHNFFQDECMFDMSIAAQPDKEKMKKEWLKYLQDISLTGIEKYAVIATDSLACIHLAAFASQFCNIGTIKYTGDPESLPDALRFTLPDGGLDEQTPFFLTKIDTALSDANTNEAESFIDFVFDSIYKPLGFDPEIQALIDSITEETAKYCGKCGIHSKAYYKNGVLVIKGSGKIEFDPWRDWEHVGRGKRKYDMHTMIIDEGITSIVGVGERFIFGQDGINIYDNEEELGGGAFNKELNLKKVILPSTLRKIGLGAFKDCHSLKEVIIPRGLVIIEKFAFENCYSLADVKIPDSVIEIGTEAFLNCKSLRDIEIPDSVRYIGRNVFEGCTLDTIHVSENNPIYDSRNNCNAVIHTENRELEIGCRSTIIPDGILSIGEEAFAGYESLTDIVIPDSVTSIGDEAFDGCSSLKNLKISDNLEFVGDQAFYGCPISDDAVIQQLESINKYATEIIIFDPDLDEDDY